METIESIVLRHSGRGMTTLQEYVEKEYCIRAAKEILSWEKGNVFLTTGFYVAGYAETDGPVGTVALAKAIKGLGYNPVIITDEFCKGFFEPENIDVEYVSISAKSDEMDSLVEKLTPTGMISIERCGKNQYSEYANMRGISITEHTAPIDYLFEKYAGKIPSIGVGDGGNEIGMGKVKAAISEKLALEPCVVATDILVLASVSNWGAYGIICALGILTKNKLVPSFDWVRSYIQMTVDMGSVDGVTHEHIVSVDGKSMDIEKEILEALIKIESEDVGL